MGEFFAPALLVVALALDAFVMALGYGAASIRISFRSLLILALVCSGALGLSMWAGELLSALFPPVAARALGCGILLLLGLAKLLEEPLKRRRGSALRHAGLSRFSPGSLLAIYRSPDRADRDGSNDLSAIEAAALALALSLDSIAAGLGAGAISLGLLPVLLGSVAVHLLAIRGGEWLGGRIARAVSLPLSPLCGGMLLMLAVLRAAT